MEANELKDALEFLGDAKHYEDRWVLSYHGLGLSYWFQRALDYIKELEEKATHSKSNKTSEPHASVTLNVNDTIIYLPWCYDNTSGITKLLFTGANVTTKDIELKTDFETDDKEFAKICNNGVLYMSDFNRVWFVDKELAESKLIELQGTTL